MIRHLSCIRRVEFVIFDYLENNKTNHFQRERHGKLRQQYLFLFIDNYTRMACLFYKIG